MRTCTRKWGFVCMSKIIIDNRTELSDYEALSYVNKVIEMGKVSNDGKQYAYAVLFETFSIACFLNKKSIRFVIHKLDNSGVFVND